MSIKETFHHAANQAARALGSPYAFLIAATGVLIWALLGPSAGYSETWQLIINTATTIITFLSVFLIQNTQNRDSKAMQLKLDEILHSIKEARNELIDLEDMPEEEVKRIAEQLHNLKNKPSESEDKPGT
ncbi:low affinity iron permease family protein [Brevifollis gellanilyticus]|uniref:Membrane protein n=1 Tax=Brevifollis gellanilyticus TaxID=748831 RepID=A0A512MDC1_9BACT|nr:low affinity iron permease family protein [Brevifollis gellanilyticus]GEP44718.1 membrane protein [Brevifollis gellanilyticus]